MSTFVRTPVVLAAVVVAVAFGADRGHSQGSRRQDPGRVATHEHLWETSSSSPSAWGSCPAAA